MDDNGLDEFATSPILENKMIDLEAGIMGQSAYASNKKFDWTLSIRKKDDSSVGDITRRHKEQVDSKYLRDYLPGWEDVQWEQLNTPPKFLREFLGECGDYKLHIILAENNAASIDDIRDELDEFMKL